MNKLLPLLAWRYIRDAREEKTVSTMISLCFFSILIGSCSLALVMAVMNGFEKATHEKLRGIHAEVIMQIPENDLRLAEIEAKLLTDFPEITSFSPQESRQLLIHNTVTQEFETIVIKGIDPEKEARTSSLESAIKTAVQTELDNTKQQTAPKTLSHTVSRTQILLGAKLAERLQVIPGDTLQLLIPKPSRTKQAQILLETAPATVGGTFAAGIEEFDSSMVISSLELLKKLFPKMLPTQLSLKFASATNEKKIVEKLRAQFPDCIVSSWKELYPALVEALILEKYAMFFILSLIMLVACMNIVSLLFMQITQKRGDIAIMRAMGTPIKTITRLFILLGMSISFLATTFGLLLATIISWLLERYPLINLPDVYFVSHLPARMEPTLLIQVFAVIMIISFIASWLPAKKTGTINISNVLRFEA